MADLQTSLAESTWHFLLAAAKHECDVRVQRLRDNQASSVTQRLSGVTAAVTSSVFSVFRTQSGDKNNTTTTKHQVNSAPETKTAIEVGHTSEGTPPPKDQQHGIASPIPPPTKDELMQLTQEEQTIRIIMPLMCTGVGQLGESNALRTQVASVCMVVDDLEKVLRQRLPGIASKVEVTICLPKTGANSTIMSQICSGNFPMSSILATASERMRNFRVTVLDHESNVVRTQQVLAEENWRFQELRETLGLEPMEHTKLSGSSRLYAPSEFIWLCEFTSEGATIDVLPTPTTSIVKSGSIFDEQCFFIKHKNYCLNKMKSRKKIEMVRRTLMDQKTKQKTTRWGFVACKGDQSVGQLGENVENAYTIWQLDDNNEKMNFLVCWRAVSTEALNQQQEATSNQPQNVPCLSNVKHQQELLNAKWIVKSSKLVSGGIVIQSLLSKEYMTCGASLEKEIMLVPDENMFAWTFEAIGDTSSSTANESKTIATTSTTGGPLVHVAHVHSLKHM